MYHNTKPAELEQSERVVLKGKMQVFKMLYPEKRFYMPREMPVSETAIDPGFFRDLYVALGEPLAKDAWSVRIYIKPFVRWIWAGGFLLLAGGILSLLAAIQARGKK